MTYKEARMQKLKKDHLKDLMEQVLEIALTADKAVMAVYETDFSIEYKDDSSPLTRADMTAHKIITEALERLEPRFPILSEESNEIPWSTRKRWETFWLVDPLDGTKDFVNRSGEFTVNIALIDKGEPVLGVVTAPALNQAYMGVKGGGSFRQTKASRTVIQCSSLHNPPRVLASKNHLNQATRRFINRMGDCKMVQAGSSLKFCRIAEGAADIYPRMGPTSEWDTAAAHCVLEAAGGRIQTLAGKRLTYGKQDVLNPPFIAFTFASEELIQESVNGFDIDN